MAAGGRPGDFPDFVAKGVACQNNRHAIAALYMLVARYSQSSVIKPLTAMKTAVQRLPPAMADVTTVELAAYRNAWEGLRRTYLAKLRVPVFKHFEEG